MSDAHDTHDAQDERTAEIVERYADVLDGGQAAAELMRAVATLDALCARMPSVSVAAPDLLDATLHGTPAGTRSPLASGFPWWATI